MRCKMNHKKSKYPGFFNQAPFEKKIGLFIFQTRKVNTIQSIRKINKQIFKQITNTFSRSVKSILFQQKPGLSNNQTA